MDSVLSQTAVNCVGNYRLSREVNIPSAPSPKKKGAQNSLSIVSIPSYFLYKLRRNELIQQLKGRPLVILKPFGRHPKTDRSFNGRPLESPSNQQMSVSLGN